MLLYDAQVEAIHFFVGLAGADLLKRCGQTEDRLRVVGQQLRGLAQVCHGFIDALEADQQATQIATGVAVVGIRLDGSLECLKGLVGLAWLFRHFPRQAARKRPLAATGSRPGAGAPDRPVRSAQICRLRWMRGAGGGLRA